MKIWRPAVLRRPRCDDATPTCAEQQATPTSPTENSLWLLASWQTTLRLVVVLVVAAGALIGVMRLAPMKVEVGVVQIAPADSSR